MSDTRLARRRVTAKLDEQARFFYDLTKAMNPQLNCDELISGGEPIAGRRYPLAIMVTQNDTIPSDSGNQFSPEVGSSAAGPGPGIAGRVDYRPPVSACTQAITLFIRAILPCICLRASGFFSDFAMSPALATAERAASRSLNSR